MYFDTKKSTVFSPANPQLESLYNWLEKHESTLGGSHSYDDLIEIYESLENELKEEKQ
ncbi:MULTISPECIES: hypothetical protein [unclassified Bacillus (in: firmicutes)]|uniref:hypothetical protein n=1 Tax=unclassified Bacillus (in: firmicutes) TaxID=185979 RepID=UPI001BE4E7C2|nr:MULTISPECIES: hypothetical protein [unclassified Bacillus (in: firmicutes)]MBT2615298.1 hypothetical protein [Bacillus sp. ISL-78]MBT2628088.1 hypothetical protein [Bacillus sp. ISL-101]MBT2716891.1 hypothetical protein [Bacillus sp. ISL-57]